VRKERPHERHDHATQGPQRRGEPRADRGGVFFTPLVDIYENDKELILYADLPGARPADVDLRYEQGELVLHAKVPPRHQETARGFLVNEYEVGDFYRAFSIHESIDAGKISAEFKNGVLVVHLPKMAEAQPRQIAVQAR
jgi:HSP20 family molecular chaperone IbpA